MLSISVTEDLEANPTEEAVDRRARGEAASSIAPCQLYMSATCTYLHVLTQKPAPGEK